VLFQSLLPVYKARMKSTPPPLRIAKPCPKKWDEMHGTAKKRFCEHCQLHVHNLSEMSERERNDAITRTGGQLCIAYIQRPDGSMAVRSRWEPIQRLFAPVRWWIASALATVLPFAFVGCADRTTTLGRVSPGCSTHQQKTVHGTAGGTIGEVTLGVPMPPPASKSSERTAR